MQGFRMLGRDGFEAESTLLVGGNQTVFIGLLVFVVTFDMA